MRPNIFSFVLLFVLATVFASDQTIDINFDKDEAGQSPEGFSTALPVKENQGIGLL